MKAPEPLKFESVIEIDNVPLQWLPLLQLFDPNLQQYPKVYVHVIVGSKRIYGFPAHLNLLGEKGGLCKINVVFISNVNLDKNEKMKNIVRNELENRFGVKDKIDLKTIMEACNKNKNYEKFFSKLWQEFTLKAYGNFLPFGRFYEGMYSIVKFTAALTPMSGGKSEMQMMYDFMRYYGTKVDTMARWSHLEFYIIPTYDEMINGKIGDIFDNFKKLLKVIKKFEPLLFRGMIKINKIPLKTFSENMANVMGYDIRRGNGFRNLTLKLLNDGKIDSKDKEVIDFLVDAFNRMPLRALSFMGSIINIEKTNNLSNWKKDDFVKLYSLKGETKGIHPKIWGCYIQQGFGNEEIIPIDNWVESFYTQILNIAEKETFLKTFKKMGKLERLIWWSSQARKTNMKLIFDLLWCIKYGTGQSTRDDWGETNELRGPNPLSCLKCSLKDECLGYKNIADKNVFIYDGDPRHIPAQFNCNFAVVTEGKIPKMVFVRSEGGWKLVDAFSGYELHKDTNLVGKIVKVKDVIDDLNK
jgi:hypothetical protein